MSSSAQILNSAPLTALSPSEAIKSMLIPSLHHYSGGGGSARFTNTLPGRTELCPGSHEVEHARRNLTGAELLEQLSL